MKSQYSELILSVCLSVWIVTVSYKITSLSNITKSDGYEPKPNPTTLLHTDVHRRKPTHSYEITTLTLNRRYIHREQNNRGTADHHRPTHTKQMGEKKTTINFHKRLPKLGKDNHKKDGHQWLFHNEII